VTNKDYQISHHLVVLFLICGSLHLAASTVCQYAQNMIPSGD